VLPDILNFAFGWNCQDYSCGFPPQILPSHKQKSVPHLKALTRQLREDFQKAKTLQGNLRSKSRKQKGSGCYVVIHQKGIAQLNIIGVQVRKLREQKGWTQDQFAVKLQLAAGHQPGFGVQTGNQDRRVPDLELFVLADVLGAKLDDLFPKDLRGNSKPSGRSIASNFHAAASAEALNGR